ncbi:MAG: UpxY family transcription antiterminator [Acidobacteriia bacterium]|nr:UpxY family transcription antiterminator [Terriglobia bacterium]
MTSLSEDLAWYAIWTASRHEKVANAELSKKGLETFLPLVKVLSQWKDRRKIIEKPLFAGYFFVHTGLEKRLMILKTTGVAQIVGINNRPASIPDQEIENIRILMRSDLKTNPHPFLKIGQRVRVRTGALQGCEGILIRKKNISTLVLSIQLLQQSVAVEIDALNVEPVLGGSR